MIDQLFKKSDDSCASRINTRAYPEVYLDILIEYLKIPAKLKHCTLSKPGMI